MVNIEYFGGLSSEPISGIFDLLESGKINENQPRFDLISPLDRLINPTGRPTSVRGTNWKNFIKIIKPYQKVEVILDKEPIWLPLIIVYAPPLGKVSFKYSLTMEQEKCLRIKIFGLQGGNCNRVTLTKSIGFDAVDYHKSLEVRALLTVTKYVKKKKIINRTDIFTDPNKLRIVDIPIKSKDSDTFSLENYEIADELTLSTSKDVGNVSWEYESKQNAKWGTKFNVPILKVCDFRYELEETGDYQVNYSVPYGYDYTFYQPKNEILIVPYCTVAEKIVAQ